MQSRTQISEKQFAANRRSGQINRAHKDLAELRPLPTADATTNSPQNGFVCANDLFAPPHAATA